MERASREPMAKTGALQNLLNELKGHGQAYENAKSNLKIAAGGVGSSSRRQAPHQSRSPKQRRPPQTVEEEFADAFSPNDFGFSFQTKRSTHPMFAGFDEFDIFSRFGGFGAFQHLFNNFGSSSRFNDPFFGMPGATFSGGQRSYSGFSNTNLGVSSHNLMDSHPLARSELHSQTY